MFSHLLTMKPARRLKSCNSAIEVARKHLVEIIDGRRRGRDLA